MSGSAITGGGCLFACLELVRVSTWTRPDPTPRRAPRDSPQIRICRQLSPSRGCFRPRRSELEVGSCLRAVALAPADPRSRSALAFARNSPSGRTARASRVSSTPERPRLVPASPVDPDNLETSSSCSSPRHFAQAGLQTVQGLTCALHVSQVERLEGALFYLKNVHPTRSFEECSRVATNHLQVVARDACRSLPHASALKLWTSGAAPPAALVHACANSRVACESRPLPDEAEG